MSAQLGKPDTPNPARNRFQLISVVDKANESNKIRPRIRNNIDDAGYLLNRVSYVTGRNDKANALRALSEFNSARLIINDLMSDIAKIDGVFYGTKLRDRLNGLLMDLDWRWHSLREPLYRLAKPALGVPV